MKYKRTISLYLSRAGVVILLSTLAFHASALTSATRGSLHDKVSIQWSEVPYAKKYQVLRSCDFDGPYLPVSGRQKELHWMDEDVEAGKQYWYKIRPYYLLGIPGLADEPTTGWPEKLHLAQSASTEQTDVIIDIVKKMPHWNSVSRSSDRYKAPEANVAVVENFIPSTQQIYDWVDEVSVNDHRRIGSDFGHQAEDYIIRELQSIMDIHCPSCEVKADRFTINKRTVHDYGLKIANNGQWGEYPAFFANNTGFTVENGGGTVKGEMIYAGEGTDEDFENIRKTYGNDLTGKILVFDTPVTILPWGLLTTMLDVDDAYYISDPEGDISIDSKLPASAFMTNFGHDYVGAPRNPASVYWKAYDLKASGMIAVLKDYPGETNKHWGPYGDQALEEMPALFVDKGVGEEIIAFAQAGNQAEITLTGTVDPEGWARNIYVQLPGQSPDTILVTTHHDAAFKGATEDGTGIAMVLAMAEAWAQVPLEEREKTLLFHLSAGHFYAGIGAKTFSETHKDGLLKDAIVNINLEHLAARGTIEDEETKQLVVNGDKPALMLLWLSEDLTTVAASKHMLEKYQPELTAAIPGNLFGNIPPGESGHYHKELGIPYINYLGAPRYLLSADDTMDKVDIPRLRPSALQSAELIEFYMNLPEDYDLWDEPYSERTLTP